MIVDCAVYEDGRRRTGSLALEEAFEASRLHDAFVWIGLHEPTAEEFDSVRREFELHELAVEDAIKAHQRPKLEVYGDSLFVVLKTALYSDVAETVEFGEIQIFIGDGFAVVVRHGQASALTETRRHVEGRPDLLALGPGAVLHAVVDHVVDDYLPVISGLDTDIRQVEYQVFSENDAINPVERIYKLKREVLEMHQATVPLLDPLEQLATADLPWVGPDTHPYFRDVHDHLLRVKGEVETFSDLLTSVLDANLTRVTVRQNEDMRKISAWVAIAAVGTLIAGVYGMNFDNMPELHWKYGYFIVLAVMLGGSVVLYRMFKKSGWL
jgi:magnesium transporter